MKYTLTHLALIFCFLITGLMAQPTNVDPSAALEIDSSTKGFLPPRLTTAQRNAVPNPALGLIVYNTTTKKLNFYDGTQWVDAPLDPGAAVDSIADADGDTKIQTEESSDEDRIRFDVEATEVMSVSSSTVDLNAVFDAIELIGAWDASSTKRIRLGDVQILWGTTPSNTSSTKAVTFSSAFIAAPVVVISSGARTAGFFTTGTGGSSSISTTGFTGYYTSTGSNFGNWIAIGRWR